MSLADSLAAAEPSPESELEAAIWRAMERHKVTCPDGLGFHDSILLAAVAYAAKDSEQLAAARRDVLHRAGAKPQIPASDCGGASRAATELNPTGSVAVVSDVAGGGATTSTASSIPDPSASAFTGVIHNLSPAVHSGDRDDKPLEVD